MNRWLAMGVCLVLVACGQDDRVSGALALSEGLEALALGDNERAQSRCTAAAELDGREATTQECLLLASIRLHDWAGAHRAAQELLKRYPGDGWVAAVEVRTGYLADPSLATGMAASSPGLVWACLTGACGAVGDSTGVGVVDQALLLSAQGRIDSAIATLGEPELGSPAETLLLLLLARDGRTNRVRAVLEQTRCDGDEPGIRGALQGVYAPELTLEAACQSSTKEASGTAAYELNRSLDAMVDGDYGLAATHLSRAKALGGASAMPLTYSYLLALLQEEMGVAQSLLGLMPPAMPATWRHFLRKVPGRPLGGRK